jgi:MFS family permease
MALSKAHPLIAPVTLAGTSFLLNTASESSFIFIALYAAGLGASNLEVGIVGSAYGAAYFISSFVFGRLSDEHGRLLFVRLGLGLATVALLAQVLAPNAVVLAGIRFGVGICLGMVSSAVTTYAYEAQGQVGKFISYGALGWICAGLFAAFLKSYEALFLLSAISSALALGLSFILKEQPTSRVRVAVFPVRLIWANRQVYFPFLIRQVGAHMTWAIWPLFLAGLGADKFWIAIITVMNTGSQFFMSRLVGRLRAGFFLLQLGLAGSAVVFLAYGLVNNYLFLLPVQVLLAFAFCALFVGGLNMLLRDNEERGTVTGLMYSTAFLASAVGPFLGGMVAQVWSYQGVMFSAAGMVVIALLASMLMARGRRS